MAQTILPSRLFQLKDWFKRRRWMLGYILCFNLFLLFSGWSYIQIQGNPKYLALFLKIEPLFAVFTNLRIGFEVLIYFKWRTFVAVLRKWFRLSVKFTWALLQYRVAFKFILYIELAMLAIKTIGRGGF